MAEHEGARWLINHHRLLLDVIRGASQASPELAIVKPFARPLYAPDRFYSFVSLQNQGLWVPSSNATDRDFPALDTVYTVCNIDWRRID
jgi:hypothetical protein